MKETGSIKELELEWSKYKYNVLEQSPSDYKRIRQLLKDKKAYPVKEFYEILEAALAVETNTGKFTNAAMHVWGYFKSVADDEEKQLFHQELQGLQEGKTEPIAIRSLLYTLARKYNQTYLLASHYFDEVVSQEKTDQQHSMLLQKGLGTK